MAEPKRARAEAALDDVSDHLGVVLQRADELLVQWSAFGASVRAQVEREAAAVGEAMAGAVDTAVARATANGIDRAITDQVGARLSALTVELGRLEARTRAAARSVAEQRTVDRRLLWVVIGGIAIANALLVAILLRRPAVVAPPQAEPAKVELSAPPAAPPAAGSATQGATEEPQADAPSSNEPLKGAAGTVKENLPRPEPSKVGAGAGARTLGAPAGGEGSAAVAGTGGLAANGVALQGSNANANAGVGATAGSGRVPRAVRLPPRATPPKR
jgi:hypothetical protein